MRWIDDAVQNGRDVALGTEILLPVKTMREAVGKQQEYYAKRQRESKPHASVPIQYSDSRDSCI